MVRNRLTELPYLKSGRYLTFYPVKKRGRLVVSDGEWHILFTFGDSRVASVAGQHGLEGLGEGMMEVGQAIR